MKEKNDEIKNMIQGADKNEIITGNEEKNEIKINKDKKEDIFFSNAKYLPLLLEEKKMQLELIDTYNKHDNNNMVVISDSIKNMQKFEDNFLKGPDYAEINDTPIYKLCNIMKKINSIEKKRLNKINDYFNEKFEMIFSFRNFSVKRNYFNEKYKEIVDQQINLNGASYLIEKKLTYKYMEEYHKHTFKEIEEVKFKAKDQIKKSKEIEETIKKLKANIKSIKDSPNYRLKLAIKSLKDFSENNENISDDLKQKINIIFQESEKGEFYKIWDFNGPIIEMPGYQFKLVEDPTIPLKLKDDNIQRFYSLTDKDIDGILSYILNRLMRDLKHKVARRLSLFQIGEKISYTRQKTNLLLESDKKSEKVFSPKDHDDLIDYLRNFQNIKAFMRVLEQYSNKIIELKKETYSIFIEIFKKICDTSLIRYDFFVANSLIELSKTFYKGDHKKGHRLLNEIKDHKLFQTETFWVNTLTYMFNSGGENIHSKLKKELDDNEVEKLAEIISKKISQLGKIFINFEIPHETIKNIINKAIEKFPQKIKDKVQLKVLIILTELNKPK